MQTGIFETSLGYGQNVGLSMQFFLNLITCRIANRIKFKDSVHYPKTG